MICIPISAQITAILCKIPTMRVPWAERVRTAASAVVTVVVAMAVLRVLPASGRVTCGIAYYWARARPGRRIGKGRKQGHVGRTIRSTSLARRGTNEERRARPNPGRFPRRILGMERTDSVNEVDTLRNRDQISQRCKQGALSLCIQDHRSGLSPRKGFEHVLAADYDAKSPATPTATDAFSGHVRRG
jgi:hypothetical protein